MALETVSCVKLIRDGVKEMNQAHRLLLEKKIKLVKKPVKKSVKKESAK